jgi:hypothetical protein
VALATPALSRPQRIISTSLTTQRYVVTTTQPGLDGEEIDARLGKLHGERVPEDVR